MANKPELKRALPNTKIKASDYNFNFEQLCNYIENGIADNAINNYDEGREYAKGDWVLGTIDGITTFYESLVDGNIGQSLTNENYWGKVFDINNVITDLNNKADVDLSNCTKPYIIESYNNGTSWYNVYSNGFCEQGGSVTPTSNTANFPVTFMKNYVELPTVITTIAFMASHSSNTGTATVNTICLRGGSISELTTDGFKFAYLDAVVSKRSMWVAKGYIR